jgi:hypothetical protein
MDSFDVHIPFWVSPVITFGVVGFFLIKSIREITPDGVKKNQLS